MNKYLDEYNQSFATLEAMGEEEIIPETLKEPILLAFFGTISPFVSELTAMRMKDSMLS